MGMLSTFDIILNLELLWNSLFAIFLFLDCWFSLFLWPHLQWQQPKIMFNEDLLFSFFVLSELLSKESNTAVLPNKNFYGLFTFNNRVMSAKGVLNFQPKQCVFSNYLHFQQLFTFPEGVIVSHTS